MKKVNNTHGVIIGSFSGPKICQLVCKMTYILDKNIVLKEYGGFKLSINLYW